MSLLLSTGYWQGNDNNSTLCRSQRKEVQLLLCCARTFINAATAETIETLCSGNLDWTWLLSLADEHDVTGSLYQSLPGYLPGSSSCRSHRQTPPEFPDKHPQYSVLHAGTDKTHPINRGARHSCFAI